MTKTNYKRICRLYKEGLTTEMAIRLIIMLAKNGTQASEYIFKFMQSEVFPRWARQNIHRPADDTYSVKMPDSFSPR